MQSGFVLMRLSVPPGGATRLPEPWEFLASLRQKAGLPPNFWEPGVKLARYTVSKWSEER